MKTEERDLLIVRTDNGDGSQELCPWSRAEDKIRDGCENPEPVLRGLALGQPVRCTFATYQHRDFVAGFERPEPEEG